MKAKVTIELDELNAGSICVCLMDLASRMEKEDRPAAAVRGIRTLVGRISKQLKEQGVTAETHAALFIKLEEEMRRDVQGN